MASVEEQVLVAMLAEHMRRVGMGTEAGGEGCQSCYAYGVICALVGASLQAVGLQVCCP
jgi:hypothetical protein